MTSDAMKDVLERHYAKAVAAQRSATEAKLTTPMQIATIAVRVITDIAGDMGIALTGDLAAAPPAETGEAVAEGWVRQTALDLMRRSGGTRITSERVSPRDVRVRLIPAETPTGECETCEGTGQAPDAGWTSRAPCPDCSGDGEGEVGHWKEPVLGRAWLIEEKGFYSRYVTSNEVLADSARDAGKVVTPVTATLRRRDPTGDAPGGEADG